MDTHEKHHDEHIGREAVMAETATTTEQTEARFEGDQWVFLIDPAWQAEQPEPAEGEERPRPPLEVVVGGWFVEQDGTTSRFHANPDYLPTRPDSPTDPVDATLQMVTRGEAEPGELLSIMTEGSVFGVAVTEENTPVVVMSPDEVPCVVLATAPAHSRRIAEIEELDNIAAWAEVSLEQLVGLLPEEGVDVLVNAGAPASMRLIAAALRQALAEAPAASAAAESRPSTESDAPQPRGKKPKPESAAG
ncbi:type VII secretion system-associated protein [Lentzea rhizosphaerae]|uniref:Type VII secretion system-associated protein n=1 Tax=Lentzea rhizosphaerae TaxID=2041025 RepID=A0ABV8BZZ7_9PSEU